MQILFEGGDGATKPEVFYNANDKEIASLTPELVTNISSINCDLTNPNTLTLKPVTVNVDKIVYEINNVQTITDYTTNLSINFADYANQDIVLKIAYRSDHDVLSNYLTLNLHVNVNHFYQIVVLIRVSSSGTAEFTTPLTFNVYDHNNNVYNINSIVYNTQNFSGTTTFSDGKGTYTCPMSLNNCLLRPDSSLGNYNHLCTPSNNSCTYVYKQANYGSSGSIQDKVLTFYLNNANMSVKGFRLVFEQHTAMKLLDIKVYEDTKANLSTKTLVINESYVPSSNSSKTVSRGI